MALKIGKWKGMTRSPHGYFYDRVDAVDDRDTHVNYGSAVIDADSADSRTDQNVNWNVGVDGSPVSRGHARTIRRAKAAALLALRRAMRQHRPESERFHAEFHAEQERKQRRRKRARAR